MNGRGKPNSHLHAQELLTLCQLGEQEQHLLTTAAEKLYLSGRAMHRSLRVARTIADMARATRVGRSHLQEALGYRADTQHSQTD